MLLLLVNKCYQTQLHGTSTPSNTKFMILFFISIHEKKNPQKTYRVYVYKVYSKVIKKNYLKRISKFIRINELT